MVPESAGNGFHRLDGGRKRRVLTEDDLFRMGIGRRYWSVSMDQIPENEAKNVVQHYGNKIVSCIEENGTGLWLWGTPRAGKTSMAAILAMEARRWGFHTFFIEASSYAMATIREKMFDTDVSIEERCKTVDLLVIDDLGKEHEGSGYAETAFEELLRIRAKFKMATIITSNVDPKDMFKDAILGLIKGLVYPEQVPGAGDGGKDWSEEEAKSVKDSIFGTDQASA